MELQTKIVENGVELGTIENGMIYTNGVDVDTIIRIYDLLNEPNPGDEYQGGIYVGEFEGKRYVMSKDEVELNWNDAKEWCSKYSNDGYDDWFLPSKDELNFLFESKVLNNPSMWYWSSTEYSSTNAWFQLFSTDYPGGQNNYSMDSTCFVRGFRVVS